MSLVLIDIDRVRRHLHETTSDDIDTDIEGLITDAQEIIADYLKTDVATLAGSPVTMFTGPYLSAALLIIGELYMNREASIADVLSPTVLSLLHRKRDPAYA
jgi:hypothetical protein